MLVIPVVSYLPTELAGCLVGPRINHGACKLARTPHIIKKKKKTKKQKKQLRGENH